MRFSTSLLVSILARVALAAPYNPYPLSNGFPMLNDSALKQVEVIAGGRLPDGPLPSNLSLSAVTTAGLIALNELFEIAFFTELIANITNNVPGYADGNKKYILDALNVIVNQETLHAIAANSILTSANQTAIQPCSYHFPVTSFVSAVALAQTFTDVALSVLPAAQSLFANDGGAEAALIPVIGSIIGQEGQQSGWYRLLQSKVPSAAPFLTGGAARFAFSALSRFIVPKSCPNANLIGLKPFPSLTPNEAALPEDLVLTFTVGGNGTLAAYTSAAGWNKSTATLSMAYLSGQNTPVIVPIQDMSTTSDGKTTFSAAFPYTSQGLSRGLTIGALVNADNSTVLNSPSAVVDVTIAGPALIEVS